MNTNGEVISTITNNLDHGNKENQYSYENHYAGFLYYKNTSSNRGLGNDITSGKLEPGNIARLMSMEKMK